MYDSKHPKLSDVTESDTGAGKLVDYSVAFSILAALGALTAAITPAIIATADAGTNGGIRLRDSVSAYWEVDPNYAFLVPFSAAALLLVIDAILSTTSANRAIYGRRYQNFALGTSLGLLTWFNLEEYPEIHRPAAYAFFLLFAAVMAYGALLGLTGRRVDGTEDVGNRQEEKVNGIVSLVFFMLLGVALASYFMLGWITFYFFELYALVSFALHYVLSAANPFPYCYYEFPINWVNRLLRRLRIMRSAPGGY